MSTTRRGPQPPVPPSPPAAPGPGGGALPPRPRVKRRRGFGFYFGRAFMGLFLVAFFGALGCAGGLWKTLKSLPDVAQLQRYVPSETTKIFDSKGRLLANVHGEENRIRVPLKDIPKHIQQAVIATEDTDFYEHFGVNPKGITRSLLVNVAEGGSVQGASTLTQQLAKNLFLDPSKNLPRKIAEAWLAIQIEHHYSKNQILEMYLNQVYWGHNAYGIESAAINYFGKPARRLNLAEGAMLAGMLRSPEYYSPYRNPNGAKHLQRLVLERMWKSGFITPAQAAAADKVALRHPGSTSYAYKVPYFTATLISELIKKYGENRVLKGGMRVQATLDLELQLKAEKMLTEMVARNRIYNVHQGALVAVEPKTGYVRVMVGGTDFKQTKFNRAYQALRPPGSTFKPFVYLTAISAGFSPGTVVVDEPVHIPMGNGRYYSPNNYDFRFHGAMTIRQALANSINIVAIKLGYAVGMKRVIETARRMGITAPLGENLSLPLGTSEITPYEMAAAYSVLANDGMRNPATMVVTIRDRDGRIIEDNRPKPTRAYDAEPVRMLVQMMEGVIQHGTGVAANIGRPAAGKTGTTSDARDTWFVGFTPDLATAVWMGNDNNSRLSYGSTGGAVCAPLWAQFMREALKDTPAHAFPRPAGLVYARINRVNGLITSNRDPDGVTEAFQAGHEPDGLTPDQLLEGGDPDKPLSRPLPSAKPLPQSRPSPVAVSPVQQPIEAIAPIEAPPQAVPAVPVRARPLPKRTPPPMEIAPAPNTDETLLEAAPELPPDNP